jgi:ATP-dependent Lon protease
MVSQYPEHPEPERSTMSKKSTALAAVTRIPSELPAIAVKNAVVFPVPGMPVPLAVGRGKTLKSIEVAAESHGLLFVVTQRNPDDEDPGPADLYRIGTVCRITRLGRSANSTQELVIEGVARARITRFMEFSDRIQVEVEVIPDTRSADAETQALLRNLREMAGRVIELSPRIPKEAAQVLESIEDPAHLTDLIGAQMRLSVVEKQQLLETADVKTRLSRIIEHLAREAEVLEISDRIQTEVRDSLDKHQREVYLREQLKAIRKELGDDGDSDEESDEVGERVARAEMPEAVKKAAQKEVRRLARMNPQSAEYTVARTYIDWLLDVPWSRRTQDKNDLGEAQRILDEDHYGLDKVKRRIVEFLAVRKLKGDMKGPILCLAGPPGVGKTSLGKSVAQALGREFVRISLGGVRDEAEIRGHRRTYVGALPGRIVQGLKRAGSMNPVFVLDEIDKLGNDFRGDPSSALLEVLDPEQNDAFSDHYLEVPVNLSGVLFVTTANRIDTIPPALRDRMEIIDVPSYLEEEKEEIARLHLVPRQLEEHGLKPEQVSVTDAALQFLIGRYTREAGVRNLSREIASVLRSVARDVASGEVTGPVVVDPARVRAALGAERNFPESKEDIQEPGVAVGLAWTPVGGDILFIETTDMKGNGKLTLTGQLGEVMKESAHAAMSFIHARAEELGIPEEMFSERNFHLHLPSGGIPKDGPSAGVTILTALTSLMTEKPVKPGLAMTGEITLRGMVLPVGGIKEKVLAAVRAGFTEVIMPRRNAGDLEEIPAHLLANLKVHFVDKMDDVLQLALGVRSKRNRPRRKKRKLPEPEAAVN